MGQFAFDVDATNFQRIVLDGSQQVPVVVDFWAPWCGPCKTLKPLLEKLADEFQGKFILAKVNADENQELAAQFGVRGIPDVKAIHQGRIVDGFSGALPEAAVREFLARIIPSPAEELRIQAAEQRAGGDLAAALQTLGEASKLDMENEQVRIDAADILLDLEQLDEARRLLDSLTALTQMDDRVQRLRARLSFVPGGQGSDDEAALREQIARQPDDMQARLNLANLLVGQGRHAEGMDELLWMIRHDRAWNEEAARKQMLAVFSLLGGHPLVSEYRRRLSSALN
ncbi:MAG TPA: tetratricopeptide repeat protein [Thiobacillaceae bacterium]|nr:tetratricopeptide repeat protein [Thiobacillaceae bacterium]HNU64882.1 tetratricopeptide repeat protein [Thiobacillaceae bacterium]